MKGFLPFAAFMVFIAFTDPLSAQEADESPWGSICDCLVADWPDIDRLRTQRVEIRGVSFKVKERAKRCERVSPDSIFVTWDYWEYRVLYSSDFFGRGALARQNHPGYCSVPGFNDSVWASLTEDGVVLSIDDPSDYSGDAHRIVITTDNVASSCQWGAIVLNSFMQVNLVENLRILSIEVDQGFFVYENELGVRRVGSLDDRISRGGGRVLSIESDGVLVEVSDSFGFSLGYRDIQHREVFLKLER